MARSVSTGNSSSSSSDSEFLAHELMGPKSAMDIDTLRAMAQAKKKRKYSDFARSAQETHQSAPEVQANLEEGELEDGEIGDMDQPSTSTTTEATLSASHTSPMAAASSTFTSTVSYIEPGIICVSLFKLS